MHGPIFSAPVQDLVARPKFPGVFSGRSNECTSPACQSFHTWESLGNRSEQTNGDCRECAAQMRPGGHIYIRAWGFDQGMLPGVFHEDFQYQAHEQ